MSSSTACFDTFNLTIVGLFELEVYIFVWFKISLWFTVNKISCNKVCCTDMISTCHTHNKKNIKAERSLQPFYKQSLSWILVKCVTFVEDVVMLEEWKCNPSTSTANGLKFMLLLEEDERSGRKKWYCSFLLLPLIQHVNSSLSKEQSDILGSTLTRLLSKLYVKITRRNRGLLPCTWNQLLQIVEIGCYRTHKLTVLNH